MLQTILAQLKKTNTRLVAVSKTKAVADILKIYDEGQRIFGENRIQELVAKFDQMPKDIQWHMIGHLQSKKVKYIAPFVEMIHSVDSAHLLTVIDKEAKKNDRIVDCLLQIKIAKEESKFGFSPNEVDNFLANNSLDDFPNIRIVGVMGMATFTSDEIQVKNEFKLLRKVFENLKSSHFADKESFKELSMGMSGDYKIAIEEGSTFVRIGSLIFGHRN